LTNCFQFRRFSFINLPRKCGILQLQKKAPLFSYHHGFRDTPPESQTLFSPHFSARPGRFLPGFCVGCQKTASLGFLRQFSSAQRRGFAALFCGTAAGYGVFPRRMSVEKQIRKARQVSAGLLRYFPASWWQTCATNRRAAPDSRAPFAVAIPMSRYWCRSKGFHAT